MTKHYHVVMQDGKQLELMAANRTHAMVTAMELCNTKEPPVLTVQVAEW